MGFILPLKESHQVHQTKGFPPPFLGSPESQSWFPLGPASRPKVVRKLSESCPEVVRKCFLVEQKVTFADFVGFVNRFPTNPKNPGKAITRISNFSVARVCKDPPGEGGGEKPPPLGDHLHSLSNTREIRNSSDRLV